MARRGFTLVELLVVIAILSVLAAILIPTIAAVKRRAQHAACAENLHNVGAAMALYAGDHDGWLPPATTDESYYLHIPGIDPTALRDSPRVLRDAMAPYVKADDVWFCPADAYAHSNVLWLGQRHLATSYFYYPVMPGQAPVWPPRMEYLRDALPNKPAKAEDVPLLCDAVGLPKIDSDPRFSDLDGSYSNHPDALVNAIRHDLSLSRLPAKGWLGSDR